MEYVTIFGSCRQQSISKYFPVSSIQEELNYPHYTKEILQQIRYLKYKNITPEHTKYCFRSSLLAKCNEAISDELYNKLKCEFDKSTVFLVEIASRISYKWNNIYMHHIAEAPDYNFFDRDKIVKKDLTDEEIEHDIIQIRKELHPRPLIIISHFSTYNHGKRHALIMLLKKICLKLRIPFLNQSNIVKQYGLEILVKEPVLSHYTPDGEKHVGKILFDKINAVRKKSMR